MIALDTVPETVADLIRRAIRPENQLGSGDYAAVYGFDHPELADFVLRTPKRLPEKFFTRLRDSSALSPPRLVLGNLRVGQPLLTLDSGSNTPISILPRQQGRSLRQWVDDVPVSTPLSVATTALQERILQHITPNPFLKIFDEVYRLNYHGTKIEITGCNILLDAHTGILSLVDGAFSPQSEPILQPIHATERCARRALLGITILKDILKSVLESADHPSYTDMLEEMPLHEARRYHENMVQLEQLLEDAYTHTDAKYKDTPPGTVVFQQTEQTQAVPLLKKYASPADVLATALKALEQRAAIPR